MQPINECEHVGSVARHRPVNDRLGKREPPFQLCLSDWFAAGVWTAVAFSALTLLPPSSFSLSPSLLHSLLLSSANSLCGRPFATFTTPPPPSLNHPLLLPPLSPPLLLPLALHLLFSPCVLPVAHDPAVQPKADCGAHTAGEAALGGALAQRTGASSASCSCRLSAVCLLPLTLCSFSQAFIYFFLTSSSPVFHFSAFASACLLSTLIKLLLLLFFFLPSPFSTFLKKCFYWFFHKVPNIDIPCGW